MAEMNSQSAGSAPLDYDSAADIKFVLESRGMAAQKRFSQNFLIHGGARETLARALELTRGSEIWEIGPGLGAMTCPLLESGAHVTAFEVDRGFCAFLREIFSRPIEQGGLTLIEGDALKTLPRFARERQKESPFGSVLPVTLFGNLPYSIASQIIAGTIEKGFRFLRVVVTLQKEVAARVAAVPGSKEYSSFSALCAWAYEVKKIADFPGGFFWPRPGVDSRALLLLPRDDFPRCGNPQDFFRVTRAAFSSRRKTIKNNLHPLIGEEELARLGFPPEARAENLSVNDFLRIAEALRGMAQ
jgi:16S rRNA (adenine1518-N6/adenine1519-N6)-dimethyltransferase